MRDKLARVSRENPNAAAHRLTDPRFSICQGFRGKGLGGEQRLDVWMHTKGFQELVSPLGEPVSENFQRPFHQLITKYRVFLH